MPRGFMITNFQFADRGYYGYSPLKVKEVCQLWLDGKDSSTLSLNANKVIQWDDKSGFDRHVSNAVDATRPTWDSSTGRVTFTAANSTFLQSAVFGSALSQPNTVFIVYKITGDLGELEALFDGNSVLVHAIYIWVGNFTLSAGIDLIDGATDANDNIHTVLFNGALSEYWINGISKISGDAGANTLNRITLGANRTLVIPADCEIMEVIVYNADISDVSRDKLTRGLGYKWGKLIP